MLKSSQVDPIRGTMYTHRNLRMYSEFCYYYKCILSTNLMLLRLIVKEGLFKIIDAILLHFFLVLHLFKKVLTIEEELQQKQ